MIHQIFDSDTVIFFFHIYIFFYYIVAINPLSINLGTIELILNVFYLKLNLLEAGLVFFDENLKGLINLS